jgi:ABC-2 type transport system permease protein
VSPWSGPSRRRTPGPAALELEDQLAAIDAGIGGLRGQLISLGGIVERNTYLIKRYGWWELAFFIWTVANTLTVVFIAKGVSAAGGHLNVARETTTLLIGAVIWSYLGIIFEILTETVAWERWEGTIEYTFMAPLSRAVHLGGMGMFAVLYGVLRTALLFAVIALFFGLHLGSADFASALLVLAVASVSFVGLGMVTAVLPLISPEKGAQLGFVAQGLLLVVSGVYYPVSILPEWMRWIATVSPATYALRGIRAAVLDGASIPACWGDVWPLLLLGAASIPLGLFVFRAGERYAKRHGKLKRSG